MNKDKIDEINSELDTITEPLFDSAEDAIKSVSLSLESYGLNLPELPSIDDEMVFHLFTDEKDQEPYYLFLTLDYYDGKYEIYASIVNQDELNILDAYLGDDEDPDDGHHVKRNRKTEDV